MLYQTLAASRRISYNNKRPKTTERNAFEGNQLMRMRRRNAPKKRKTATVHGSSYSMHRCCTVAIAIQTPILYKFFSTVFTFLSLLCVCVYAHGGHLFEPVMHSHRQDCVPPTDSICQKPPSNSRNHAF